MSLKTKFRKAERLCEQMRSEDPNGLRRICSQIRIAQAALLASARQQMERCLSRCGGICCRNIELDPIISHWDLMLILSLAPQIRSRMCECLRREDPLFRTDCVFLTDGIGPCIFPDNLRPEVCVTTFCQNDRPIRSEIRRVKRKFFLLSCFVRWCQIRAKSRAVKRAVAAVCPRRKKSF